MSELQTDRPGAAQRDPDSAPATGGSRPHARRRPVLAWLLLAAGALILLASVWVGWRSYQAYRDLQSAAVHVAALQEQLADPSRLRSVDTRAATIAALQADAASARSAVDDPVFRLAAATPVVGPNLDALRQVGLTVDSLATEVVPSLADVARTLNPSALAPRDGAFDPAPIAAVAPQLQRADDAVAAARARLAGIDRSAVIAPVGEAIGSLEAKLDTAASVTGPAARTARLLPNALGANGPRTYLVLFQNLAEPRATGGIFGSYAVVTADQGRITIVDQSAARSLEVFDPPAGPLTDGQRALFGSAMATFPADVNLTPDFPTAARMFRDMYTARTGGTVDGVLAIDPVALSYLLRGSPPVDAGDGVTVDAGNVVATLLSTAYQTYDGANQDRRDQFLAGATAAILRQIMSGATDPAALVTGVRRSVDERRLLFYSTRDDEQSDLAQSSLGGATSGPAESSGIGVFLNDAKESKLGYYLAGRIDVVGGSCAADGSRPVSVTVAIDYDPPAANLPGYVTGGDRAYRVHVLLAAPAGAEFDGAELDGGPMSLRLGADLGRNLGATVVELSPGVGATLTYALTAAPGQPLPAVVHTPGVNEWPVTVEGFAPCG